MEFIYVILISFSSLLRSLALVVVAAAVAAVFFSAI